MLRLPNRAMQRTRGTVRSRKLLRQCGKAGFTIPELLVSVAIIGILLSIVVAIAAGARRTAARTKEVAGLRGVMIGWTGYAMDQRGALLPGYRSGLEVRDEYGEAIPADAYGGDAEVRRRYPWRLAPWLDRDFGRLYVGENEAVLGLLRQSDRKRFYYFASLYPSFGLNSAFVGGDEARFPSDPLLPNGLVNPFAKHCVTRLSIARRPARTIVFAGSRTGATEDGSISEGNFRVDAPWLNVPASKWAPAYVQEDPLSCGGLSTRGSKADVTVATMDGAAEIVQVEELRDMTRWCDTAPEREWWIGK